MSEENYIGEDGLLYCGVCHEPKEALWENGEAIFGSDRHPRLCRCERERQANEEQKLREIHHRLRVAELRRNCFAYPAMYSWTFANASIQTERLAQCRHYVENWSTVSTQNAGLLFWGDVGTGKTYLAACIANALIEQEIPVRMTNLAAVINHGFEDREAYIHLLCSCPLLILDDLGMERDTKFGLETVYDVIDGRYLSGKPLIVTTNLTLRELQKETDLDKRRIYDRVLTMTTPLFFGRENLRSAGKNQKMALMKKLIAEPERRNHENERHLV